MYNGVQQPLFVQKCSNTMQGFNSTLQTSTQYQTSQYNNKMCQYYNRQTKKKSDKKSEDSELIQLILQDEKGDYLQLQNIKIQKQLNSINQNLQYPYQIQQTFNSYMMMMKDVYSFFFHDIMREYRLYSQVISDLDMGYPTVNKIKKSVRNKKEWFEQNYINILKCQMIKNCQVKQTINEFFKADIPKKAKNIIEKQQEQIQYSRMKVQQIGYINNNQKQQSPRYLLHSASPLNSCNDTNNKNIQRRKFIKSFKQDNTESSCQNVKEDYFENAFIFQKKTEIDQQIDIKDHQQRRSQKRSDNDLRLLTTQDNCLFNKTYGNNFSNFQSDLQNQLQSNQQNSVIYLQREAKIRMKSFNDDYRNERSYSLINRDYPQKNQGNEINKQNLVKLKQNLQQMNQRMLQTEKSFPISPKQNYHDNTEGSFSYSQNIRNVQNSFQNQLIRQNTKEGERKRENSKYENTYYSEMNLEENNQIFNLIKKEMNRNSLKNIQIPNIMIVNKSKNIISNLNTSGNQVLKQQNMQLLQIENLHTTPTSRTKQGSFIHTIHNGTSPINLITNQQNNNKIQDINTSIKDINYNSNGLNEINQLKPKLIINTNCSNISKSKTPQSLKGRISFNLKDNLLMRKQENHNQNYIISKQKQNQTIQNILPLTSHESFLNSTTYNHTQKDNNLKLHQSYQTEQRNFSNALPITPMQQKISRLEQEDESRIIIQNKLKDKGALNELIYFISPKNSNNSQTNTTILSSVTPQPSSVSPLASSITPQPSIIATQQENTSQKSYLQNNKSDCFIIQDQYNKDQKDLIRQSQINKVDTIKDKSPPRKINYHISQTNQREINRPFESNDAIKIQNIQTNIMKELESKKLNQDIQSELQSQNNQNLQKIQKKILPLDQNTIWFQNFTNRIQTQVDIINNDKDDKQKVMCIPEKNDLQVQHNEYSMAEEKSKLKSLDENIQKYEINNQNKKKMFRDILQFKDTNQMVMLKLDQQNISNNSTPFRSTSYGRQRVYKNQRQILAEIQQVNPIISQIQQPFQTKTKFDTEITESISNDNELKKYKIHQQNKKQNTMNSYFGNERSEDKHGYKKFSPYIQNNHLFKQQKCKQENAKQVMNQILYQANTHFQQQNNSKVQNNPNNIQNVKLKSIIDQNDDKQLDNLNKNYDDNNSCNGDQLNPSRRNTFIIHDNILPFIKQITNLNQQDPYECIEECIDQKYQPDKQNSNDLTIEN